MTSGKEFSGKVVLVTGASRGIGKAIALHFAQRGADIAFNYLRSHTSASAAQQEIEALGVRCVKARAHLGDAEKLRSFFRTVESEFGRLDVLVNNAASGVNVPADELEDKHWNWTMDINAKAAWLCSIEASRLMPDGGHIVNITSEGSRHVLPNYFAVGTSKAALEAITRYLAVELAPNGISVNAVSGGYVDTDALSAFTQKDRMLAEGEKTLTGRMVTVEDIANAVGFLCSPDAEMIRGQILLVDGGATLRAG